MRRAITIEQADPARQFLTDGERRGVLEMRAADFDYAREFLCLGVQGVAQLLDVRDQKSARSFVAAAMCMAVGKVSLRRLRHIDVVVRVNGLLCCPSRRRQSRWRDWR